MNWLTLLPLCLQSRVLHDEATFEEGVRCVVMPCCGFTFDANHFDDVPGEASYTCPLCAEARPSPAGPSTDTG